VCPAVLFLNQEKTMFDWVKGLSQGNQLQAEDDHDTRQDITGHTVSIHVTGLLPLVFLFMRRSIPVRPALNGLQHK
jgi:hypothetical protein